MWIDGRLMRIVKTARPLSVWLEIWSRMSEKEKKKEIRAWEIEGPKREESRRAAGVEEFISSDQVEDYEKHWLGLSNFTQFLQVQLCQSFANQFGHQRLLHRQNWA